MQRRWKMQKHFWRTVVVENIDEVKEFLEEEGMDIQGMSDEELEEAAEVFPIPDGRYLIVEG